MDTDVVEALQRWRDELPMSEPPVEHLANVGTVRSRRRRQLGLLAVSAVVVAALAMVPLLANRQEDRAPLLHAAANPVGVAWWADGTLHLAEAELELSGVYSIAEVSDGVVVARRTRPEREAGDASEIRYVRHDGHSEVLARVPWPTRIVSSRDSGWVAWVSPDKPASFLHVFDTHSHREVDTRRLPDHGPRFGELDEGSVPLAIDGGAVYYAALDGDYRWVPGHEPERLDDGLATDLVDVAQGVRLVKRDSGSADRSELIDAAGAASFVGRPLHLAPAGKVAVVRDTSLGLRLVVRSGETRILSVPPGRAWPLGSAVGFPGSQDLVAVIGTPDASNDNMDGVSRWPAPPYGIVRCVVATGQCRIVVDGLTDPPILAAGA